MNPVSKYVLLATVCLSVLAVFANCSVIEDNKKDSATSQTGGCFLFADPAVIKPGETSVLKPSPGLNWNEYQSITVEGQTLTKASINGVTVKPANSRSYVAKGTKTDGKEVSCDVTVKVEGADFDAACTLIADPAFVTSSQAVNITMQVSGTEQISESLINGVYAGGAAGGSTSINISKTQTIIGTIKAADGRSTECSVTVEMKYETASGECKVQASADDNQKLAAANAKYETENQQAKANKVAELVAGRPDFPGVQTKEKGGYMSEDQMCMVITGENNTPGCTLKSSHSLAGGVRYALIDISGQLYEIYGYNKSNVDIKVVTDTGSKPAPVIVYRNYKYVEEIEVEICECTYEDSFSPGSGGASSDTAEPYFDFTWYPVASGLRDASYKGGLAYPYDLKAAYQKTKLVSPPEGTPKPPCPEEWNEAT